MRSNFSKNLYLFEQSKLSLPSLMEPISSNSEIISATEKMSRKLHGKLTGVSKKIKFKMKIMKVIN